MVSRGLRGIAARRFGRDRQTTTVHNDVTPRHTRLEGTTDYEAALDTVIARATHRLRVFDRALGPRFDTARRHELLRNFLLANRANRIQIVLHHVDHIVRDCPRLLGLLRSRSGSISIHQTLPDAQGVYDPFAVADECDFVHRFHYEDTRSVLALDDPHGARQFVERFEGILSASRLAPAATPLGL
jgi:hypothetical protein